VTSDLHRRLEAWLRYGDELGLGPFYRDRARTTLHAAPAATPSGVQPPEPGTLPVSVSRPLAAVPSLFDLVESVPNDSLERIRADLGDCTRCRLHRSRTKIVFGTGNPRAELVFVGEGPGHDEDQQGEPFVGRAGQLLTQMIEAMGLSRSDVYICNVVKCRPPENRTPERDEIATCAPFLLRQLAVIRPRVIVCLGAVAAQTLLGFSGSISRIRGQWYDYRGARLLATYHPAYLLRNPSAKVEVWSDLKQVMAALGLKPPPPRPRQRR
jgi:uracil-DNA glycosylase family 4